MENKLTDNEIVKALECCGDEEELHYCVDCPYCDKENDFCQEDLHRDALDLINRLQAEKEALINGQETLQKYIAEQKAEIERLQNSIAVFTNNAVDFANEIDRHKKDKEEAFLFAANIVESEKIVIANAKAEAYKEFADKVDEILKRYAHLHKYADKARSSKEEYADGTPMEMVSVWEVLSLKKWEMCDYETMNTLEDNIETIAKERVLTELEKDLRLLKKELVGDNNA